MTDISRQFIGHRLTRRIVLVFILLMIMFLAIWARAFIGSMKDFARGEGYFNNEQYIKAITYFDRSMHWYTPFNSYIKRSAEYLWKISEQAEQINDNQLSLIALETIRNGFYSSRSFYTPGANWIKRCDDEILNITKDQNENRFKSRDENDFINKIFRQDIVYNDPAICWTIVLEIGLFGWIGAVLGIIFFCLRPSLKTDKYIHTYWFWILIAVINYSLWIIGMIKA